MDETTRRRAPRLSIEAGPGVLDVEIGVPHGEQAAGLALLQQLWPNIAALGQAVRDASTRAENGTPR